MSVWATTRTAPPLSANRECLHALKPQLRKHELDVCAWLLLGRPLNCISIDLSILLPTPKTVCNRAFARLGIRYRHALFALFARMLP